MFVESGLNETVFRTNGSQRVCSGSSLCHSSDVPPEPPSTSGAAAGQPEASQGGGVGEAPAEANTSAAAAGTAALSAPHTPTLQSLPLTL